ncbi:MAG: hypothetical protein ACI8T1_004739 [Verrucomicrobiales bacterium]
MLRQSSCRIPATCFEIATCHLEVLTRPRAQRKGIVLEELSTFLTILDGDRITRELYERMRKYNCWVISVIQQFGRFYESDVRSSVMGNSRVLFLLKQRDKQDLDRIDESFPLPDITKHAIANFPEPGQAARQSACRFRLLPC